MKVTTKITWDKFDNVIEHEFYDYDGPIALCCGPSKEQDQTFKKQDSLFDTMTSQAQQVFGNSSGIFNSIKSAFTPIVAAGPNQEGYSPEQLSNLESSAITQGGVAARNAMTAVKQANAAVGGGNVYLPGGASIGANVNVANAAAENTASQLAKIKSDSATIGRNNFFAASQVLGGAPSVFSPATQAGSAATGAGSSSAQTANEITQAQQSWLQPVAGILGGLAKTGLGIATGGISSIAGSFGGANDGGATSSYANNPSNWANPNEG